jgi:hypothetical protein
MSAPEVPSWATGGIPSWLNSKGLSLSTISKDDLGLYGSWPTDNRFSAHEFRGDGKTFISQGKPPFGTTAPGAGQVWVAKATHDGQGTVEQYQTALSSIPGRPVAFGMPVKHCQHSFVAGLESEDGMITFEREELRCVDSKRY